MLKTNTPTTKYNITVYCLAPQREVVIVAPHIISTQCQEARITQVDICTANLHINVCLRLLTTALSYFHFKISPSRTMIR